MPRTSKAERRGACYPVSEKLPAPTHHAFPYALSLRWQKKAIIYLGKGVYGKGESAPASSKVKLTHPPLRHGTF